MAKQNSLGVRLETEVHAALRKRALRERRSMSQLAAMFIEKGLRENGNGNHKEPRNGSIEKLK